MVPGNAVSRSPELALEWKIMWIHEDKVLPGLSSFAEMLDLIAWIQCHINVAILLAVKLG